MRTAPESYQRAVYSFVDCGERGEDALCRWLRARKFDVEKTKEMIREAAEKRAEPQRHAYWRDASEALGIPPSVYVSMFPQVYCGFAKNGCPVFVSRPAVINVDEMNTCLSLDNIVRFHWSEMEHTLPEKFIQTTPAAYQCLTIIDLRGLAMSQINKRTLRVVKEQAAIDSTCYPETMYKTIVVGVPGFFSLTWKLIKTFIDARTQSKIELISNQAKAEKRLLELIDADQLPSDFGGTAPSTAEQMHAQTKEDGIARRTRAHVKLGRASVEVTVGENEILSVDVYTKSRVGGLFQLFKGDAAASAEISVVNTTPLSSGDSEFDSLPTAAKLPGRWKGPGTFTVKCGNAEGKYGAFASMQDCLVVCTCHVAPPLPQPVQELARQSIAVVEQQQLQQITRASSSSVEDELKTQTTVVTSCEVVTVATVQRVVVLELDDGDENGDANGEEAKFERTANSNSSATAMNGMVGRGRAVNLSGRVSKKP
jgi:hypothetical protein